MIQSDPRAGAAERVLTYLVAACLLLAALGVILLALGGLGVRWAWWDYRSGFGMLRWSVLLGAATAILALLALLGALWLRRWRALGLAVLALLVGLGTLGVPLSLRHLARTVPAIHDITTDWEDPPAFVAALPLRAGAPNPPEYDGPSVATQQRRAYPDLRPATYREAPADVFSAAERVAGAMGWEVVAAEVAEGRIEAVATTSWFGFKDDVVVRIRPLDEGGTRLDVRSKSRVGRSDLGANAKRMRRFLERLGGEGLTAQ